MVNLRNIKSFNESYGNFIEVHINENVFRCELCKSHKRGLIGREIEGDGMIFFFKKEIPLSFHTKGCIEPIDIVFVLKGKIVKIYSNCQPDSKENFNCFLGDTVLEFQAGTCLGSNIKEGDLVKINNPNYGKN